MASYKIQVPVIVNSNTAQVLVVTEIPLTPPAFKIDEIHKVIEIDDCAAVCDKVIINGRLIKNIHTTVDACCPSKLDRQVASMAVEWNRMEDAQGRPVWTATAEPLQVEIKIEGLFKVYEFRQGSAVWHKGKTSMNVEELKRIAEKFLQGKPVFRHT